MKNSISLAEVCVYTHTHTPTPTPTHIYTHMQLCTYGINLTYLNSYLKQLITVNSFIFLNNGHYRREAETKSSSINKFAIHT